MKNKSKNKEPENLLCLQSLFLPLMLLSRLSPQPSSGLLSPTTPSGCFLTSLSGLIVTSYPAVGWTQVGTPTVHCEGFSCFYVSGVSLLQTVYYK